VIHAAVHVLRIGNNAAAGATFNVANETYAAAVMLRAGVVKALALWEAKAQLICEAPFHSALQLFARDCW
jgi:hypothetical protein